MKPGDLAVIPSDPRNHWGYFGVVLVLELTKRTHVPAAIVLLSGGEVAEFDLDELEVISEAR